MRIQTTRKVNVFNQNIRKIKCIENEYDYFGNGELFKEEKLQKGTIYTFVRGEIESYGSIVFIEEVPSKCGFHSCLFAELEAYDKQIIVDEYVNWLLESLKRAEEDLK